MLALFICFLDENAFIIIAYKLSTSKHAGLGIYGIDLIFAFLVVIVVTKCYVYNSITELSHYSPVENVGSMHVMHKE